MSIQTTWGYFRNLKKDNERLREANGMVVVTLEALADIRRPDDRTLANVLDDMANELAPEAIFTGSVWILKDALSQHTKKELDTKPTCRAQPGRASELIPACDTFL